MPTNLGFAAKGRLAGSLEQGSVSRTMASGQRGQLGRQSECDQKVEALQQSVFLLLLVKLSLLVLSILSIPFSVLSAYLVYLPSLFSYLYLSS